MSIDSIYQVVYMKRLASRAAPNRVAEKAWVELLSARPPSVGSGTAPLLVAEGSSEDSADLEDVVGLMVVCDNGVDSTGVVDDCVLEVLEALEEREGEALDEAVVDCETDDDDGAAVDVLGGAVRGPPSGMKGISRLFPVLASQSLTMSETNVSTECQQDA
jgi:hypothetical protein